MNSSAVRSDAAGPRASPRSAGTRTRRARVLRGVPLPVEREHLLDAVPVVTHERADRAVERVDPPRRLEVRGHQRVAHVAAEQQHALAAVRGLVGGELAPRERVDHRRAVVVEARARQARHRGERLRLEHALRRQAVAVAKRLADERAQPGAAGLRVATGCRRPQPASAPCRRGGRRPRRGASRLTSRASAPS